MTVLTEKDIVGQTSAVDNMLGLLCNICFMGLQVELVSSATELIRGMILQADAAELSRTVIGT